MKFNLLSIHTVKSLLAIAAGTSAAAEPLSAPSLAALKIERGVVYHEAPLLSASGGTAPYRFAFDASGLPPGLRLDARGLLSGLTCGGVGSFALGKVSVTDGAGESASETIADPPLHESKAGGCTLTVGAAWQVSSLGQPFNATLVASGGTAPYTFSVIAGQLPAGLTLQPSGAIGGTPSAAASHRFTVVVRDAQGATGVHDATLNVIALNLSPATLTLGSVGDAYNQTLSTSGGSGPYSYEVSAGSLPAGLSLSRNGKLTGTPIAAGTARFTITATDASRAASARSYALRIGAANHASASAYDNATQAARAQSSLAARGNAVHSYVATPAPAAPTSHPMRALEAAGSASQPDAADTRGEPADDAAVAGLQVAEVEALKRLSAAQLRNVFTRLDGDIDCRPDFQQQIQLNTLWRDARPAGLAVEPTQPALADKPGCTSGPSGWAAGTLDYGRVSGALGAAGSRFSSPGISAGVDLAPLHGVRSGIALGHGQDRSEINGELGRVDSRSESITAYGSWQAPLGVRVNAALGQSRTLLERQRVIGDTLAVQGQRRVTQRYGTLAGSTRFDVGSWKVSPRVGVEHMSAALDAFAESAASAFALGYDSARMASSDVRGGLALTRQWRPALWTVEPELSVDWHRRLQGGMTQTLRYADDPLGSTYTLASSEPTAEFAQLGVGVRMRHPLGWSLTLGARGTLDGSAPRNAGYSAAMHWPF